MAFKLVDQSYCPIEDGYRKVYVLDSAADVAALPACCVGSMAIVADKGGAVYMVNASGEWKEQ